MTDEIANDKLARTCAAIGRMTDDKKLLIAINKMAADYIADHPADEHEPVTTEWLISVGFRPVPIFSDGVSVEGEDVRLIKWTDSGGEWYIGGNGSVNIRIPYLKTRGEVRQFCKLIGAKLK